MLTSSGEVLIKGFGTVKIYLQDELLSRGIREFMLKRTTYIPTFLLNTVSIKKLNKAGFS
jgi:hypothetical protein